MPPPAPDHGRGVASNPASRFERLRLVVDDEAEAAAGGRVPTLFFRDASRTIITSNDSPDVPFEVSLNPYRGCEHGCAYCYARPTHEYLGFSAGLDFETRVLVKEDAPALLRAELARRSWTPRPLAMSGVTDPYQPVERSLGVTRRCLEVLAEARHPVGVITKSATITRDIDVLGELARHGAVSACLSITTLDEEVRRAMEPRASTADLRLEAVARMNDAGIPCGVMLAPIVPGLTDHEIPQLLARAAQAGARFAGYILLRLPHGVKDLFAEWLVQRFPDRAKKVLTQVRDVRGGRLYAAEFGERMRGTGPVAELTGRLFATARERAGIPASGPPLNADAFRRPSAQRSLFE